MQIDVEPLRTPLDEGNGCGPDLEWDDVFTQLAADLEAVYPSRADAYHWFRSQNTSLDAYVSRCLELMKRTRDIRLLVAIAKLGALSGDLDRMEAGLGLTQHYLATAWEHVHPQPVDGDFSLRVVNLERLDEFASTVLPLQYTRLVVDRAGQLSYRDLSVAAGEIAARDGDHHPKPADVDRILRICDLDKLVRTRDVVARMVGQLKAIGTLTTAGTERAVSLDFPKLTPLLDKILEMLEAAVVKRDASLARIETPAGPAGTEEAGAEGAADLLEPGVAEPTGTVRSVADVEAALAAVCGYFDRTEPSSPALLLVRQAKALIGLSFPQILQKLAPKRLPEATIALSGPPGFVLSLEALGNEFPLAQRSPGDPLPDRTFEVASRATASGLLNEVASWYRASEPSNPIPLLLERAGQLMAKDFSALLTELTAKK